jgi:DNA-binding HxlR family transcriptional regulator
MRWNEIDTVECSIARALSVVVDRWTMMIVRDVFLGIRRFDAMQDDLGLTPHRLSHRLGKLVRDGILARVDYEKRPRRFEYRLTEKGVDLFPLIVVLNAWGRSLDGRPRRGADRVGSSQLRPRDKTGAHLSGLQGKSRAARDEPSPRSRS